MHHPAPVSLDAIRAAIPARCFERRMTPSCLALARSIGLCLAVLVLSSSMHVVAYALAQGTALTGLFFVFFFNFFFLRLAPKSLSIAPKTTT